MTEKKINQELLEHLLFLARLSASQEEKQSLLKDLEEILSYLEKIDNLNLEGVDPFIGAAFIKNVFRGDEENKEWEEKFNKDLILKETPEMEEGFVKGPRVKNE